MLNLMKAGIFLLCFLYSLTSMANDKVIKVSLPSFPPFYFTNAEQGCKGVVVDILDDLSKRSSINFTVIGYPYARILHFLSVGKLDAALIFKNTRIQDDVDYVGLVSKSKIIVLTSSMIKIKKYHDLMKLNAIAVIRNASLEQQFDNDKTLHKVSVANYIQALKMLKLHRVDAVVGSLVGLEYASQSLEIPFEQLNMFELGKKEWWLHVVKNVLSPIEKKQLAEAIKSLYQSDLIDKYYQKHLENCGVK